MSPASPVRLLLDEMLTGSIAAQLRTAGFDVLAVVDDPELISTADEDLLVHAANDGRCVVTANIGDFAAIATRWRAERREHAGLVYVASRTFPQDRSFVGAMVAALAQLVQSAQAPAAGAETYLRRSS